MNMLPLQQFSYSVTALLAETKLSDVSLEYRETITSNDMSIAWYILVPVSVALMLGLVHHLADRPPAIVNTPLGMLHELCRVHRFRRGSRILLETIAEAAVLHHPAILFVSAKHLDDAVAQAENRIVLDKKQRATLGLIRRRLFG